ncbi:hypothetical protein K449DRAFT_395898 [Hypoxylon sp. EC38]|nr:hypothetical protein K449DRAFT_395898 [Hypoxylon sp. EC38]
MGSVLSDKDVNAPVQIQDVTATKNVIETKDVAATNDVAKDGRLTGAQSLEYHRQVLQSKMAEEKYGANAITKTITKTTASTEAALPHTKNPQSRLLANIGAATGRLQQYISPSDDIMSPCTAKLNAFKGRLAGRAKPKSLFARTSAKKFDGKNIFGAKDTSSKKDDSQSSI